MGISEIKISASMACADFICLERDIRQLEEAGVCMLHFDVVDGSFADTFIMGPPIIQSLRPFTKLIFDVHLMIYNPAKFIRQFVEVGSDYICFHLEACDNPVEVAEKIKSSGIKAALALCPETPAEKVKEELLRLVDMVLVLTVHPGYAGQPFISYTLDKIKKLYSLKEKMGLMDLDIAADGNINPKTIPSVVKAGANVLVGGSSGLFVKGKSIKECAKAMFDAAYNALEEKKNEGK